MKTPLFGYFMVIVLLDFLTVPLLGPVLGVITAIVAGILIVATVDARS